MEDFFAAAGNANYQGLRFFADAGIADGLPFEPVMLVYHDAGKTNVFIGYIIGAWYVQGVHHSVNFFQLRFRGNGGENVVWK